MSGPIQVIPPGLLGFLQLKNAGTNPREFPEVLQPVMELREWYLQAFARNHTVIDSVTVGAASDGFAIFPTLITGDSVAWWVQHFSIRAELSAGSNAKIKPAYDNPVGGASRFLYLLGDDDEGQTPDNIAVFARQPFFLPPNSELGVYVQRNLASQEFVAYVRYTELPL